LGSLENSLKQPAGDFEYPGYSTTAQHDTAMKLLEDVTFDSLAAVRQELREWFGPDAKNSGQVRPNQVSRDMLLSIIIHSLAAELSDVRVRSQIQALLSDLGHPNERYHVE
jgi:hypothetical protein